MALPEKNFVHADEIRRDAIKREELSAREFPPTWGFLCGPKLPPDPNGFRTVIAKYQGAHGDWILQRKRIVDNSDLGLKAREIDNEMKPKLGTVLQGNTHRTNIIPGLTDKYGRKLTVTDEGYECIPNRSGGLALRSHYEHTIGDSVCIRGYNPNEKYKYPLTSSQLVGWRPKTLEVFGVAEHGLKKGIAAMHGYK